MSYSEPPPPPPQYGAPVPPPGGAPAGTSGMAIASLVLGIVGILSCGCLVFSILAIVFGRIANRDIVAGTKSGAGLAKAGFILGIIGVALGVVYWIVVIASGGDVQWSTGN